MLQDLLTANAHWAEEKVRSEPDYFHKLAELQKPEYLWIGCSDSRVPANVITGLEPGEVFVHRNVANLVHRGDLNLLSVLEYAVDALKVKHVIVCGHYGCGGVRATVDGLKHGIIDHWLQPVRDVEDANRALLQSIEDSEHRHERLCELTIMAQVESLARTPIIQSAWLVHPWMGVRPLGRTPERS